ncbi:DNA phosphorothioation system sulfurtransferase DndC [Kitasatospora sp. NPDC056076]|uniref:DNA phosphorothioation system sulfurtransferase DndC n=1 Tax=Kitasatospora sp. NPDC056076 TaxID=3345703 RepID=UPI0035D73BBB
MSQVLIPGLAPTRRRAWWEPYGSFPAGLEARIQEIRDLYVENQVPFVIGFSGGKDSMLVVLLTWLAVAGLAPEQRHKPVFICSTDTGVENPVVVRWVDGHLAAIRQAAVRQEMPVEVHRLRPVTEDTYWFSLIGRGYAAPRALFRWCTERLKIRPNTRFIREVVSQHGETILLLGTRKAESAARAKVMKRHEKGRTRERLSPNGDLPNSMVYTPVEDFENDDVWMALMQLSELPWGRSAKELLALYQGASPDAECPLVMDSTTPSCGSSRFGCWTCTVVEQDRSMTSMITNEPDEYAWMRPLLALRNDLADMGLDRGRREFTRWDGRLTVHKDRLVHGLYTQEARADWLRKVLETQEKIRRRAPAEYAGLELISTDELVAIRRQWVTGHHEIEDLAPGIYEEATGRPWPGTETFDSMLHVQRVDLEVLREVAGSDREYRMLRDLLDVEQRFTVAGRRTRRVDEVEKVLHRYVFDSEDEALEFALQHEPVGPEGRQMPLFTGLE